jgi:hypothetical protein
MYIQDSPFYTPPTSSRVNFSPMMLSGQPTRPQQPVAPAQSGGSINPISAYNMATQFGMPDYVGIGSSSSAPSAAPAAGGQSWIGAAGPWAALAAAIAANETWANKQGRRPDNFSEHLMDMVSGKVLQRDASALGDSIGGPFGDAVSYAGKLGNPSGLYSATKDSIKKPVEWVSKMLGGLF